MKPRSALWFAPMVALALGAVGCSESSPEAPDAGESTDTAEAAVPVEITVYSGRSKSFMDQIFDGFEVDTGVTVKRVYGKTAEIALKLQTEGDRSPADVVLAQDAGALGALSKAGLLAELPDGTLDRVDRRFISDQNDWVATSLRLRTLAYRPARVSPDALPASVFDLTDPAYRGRVGWAPSNASFQAFVTAMRNVHGESKTRQWLLDMQANDAKAYPKNTAIIQGLAAGEVDLGLPNHYYLLRFTTADPEFPVAQARFAAGDIGNMTNVAGAGVLQTSKHPAAAQRLVDYLLSEQTQRYFVGTIYEYPVVSGIDLLPEHHGLTADPQAVPDVDLNTLDDLPGTLELLRDVGLL
ncbi:MAG: iron ABC transporter substrate-binding protein [Planctomycetota bacterium]